MQEFLFVVASILFFVFLILNALSWLSIWEEKDHNWKRLIIHIRDTKQGRNLIIGPLNLLKWVVIFSYAATVFINGVDIYFHLLVLFLYLLLVSNFVRRSYLREYEFPKFYPYTILILFAVIIIEASLFLFAPLDRYLWMLVLDKILTIVLAIFIFIASVFFDFSRDLTINRAIKKVEKHKNLLTITVVGSYARGSTKEFIARILKTKYNILETKTSFDTPLGISRTIVSGLTPDKQIFIAEMEDYREGEIREMSRIIKPKIAVVTGINDKNASLFLNMNKILDSKFEAIEELSSDAIALFNKSDENAIKLYRKTKRKKFTYSFYEKGSDIYIENVIEDKFYTSFTVCFNGKKHFLRKIKIIGRQNIESLLPGILIGIYIGIDFSLIRNVLYGLKPLEKTMEPKILSRNAILIDDSYNVNYNSVIQASEYAKQYKSKKTLVLEPIAELGKNAKSDHEFLGEKIGEIFDYLFLTNGNYKKDIIKGLKKVGKNCKVEVLPPSKIANFISSNCKKGDLIVLEGHEAGRVLGALSFKSAN